MALTPFRVLLCLLGLVILVPAAEAQVGVPAESLDEGSRSRVAAALAPPASSGLLPPPPLGEPVELVRERRVAAADILRQERRRNHLPLIAAGVTLLVAGAFIDDSAGTVVMVTGATLAAVGVYRWAR